ncbi:unnamed protein product [Cuscuta epithymum]|uniref:Thioredoxin domain-containing protein n=1 Tax=Cuscuta epithymum TaxID=186058 RepID=A0AAV0DY25_9ASTE|nr:unnamed protein product [Cuscuta epithymum]
MGGVVKELKSKEELNKVIADGSPVVVHFWATWCEASKHMDQVFSHLSTDFPHTHFLRVSLYPMPKSYAFCVCLLWLCCHVNKST